MKSANVVCTQLGYRWALNAGKELRRENSAIALYNIGCQGNETSLSQCDYPSIGVPFYQCRTWIEAAVICSSACLNGRCPADIETTLESPSQLTAQVFWAEPAVVSTYCENVDFSSSHSPGERFEEGITVVSYFVENAAGVRAECNFTVSVTRKKCGNVTCPPDVMTSLAYRSDTTAVFWGEPTTADDSCNAASLTSSHSPGDEFIEGATVVSYLFGNTIVCNFTVQVIEEARSFPLAAPIIPLVAFFLLLIFFCILWVLKMPTRLQRRPLPGVPKNYASYISPAYQPNSPGDKDSDAESFYDFILEEVDPETEGTTSDTYGISGPVLSEDKLQIMKSQDSQIGQNGHSFKQQSAEGNGGEVKTESSLVHEGTGVRVDDNRLKENEKGYCIDPGEHDNEDKRSYEENGGNMENEDSYIVMKNLKGDVTVDNHRGEGHERAILDQLVDLDNVEDVLVLNLGEF